MVIPPISLHKEVSLRKDTRERVTLTVMIIFFDDTDDLVRGCGSHEDQHARRVNRCDFDLVARENRFELL